MTRRRQVEGFFDSLLIEPSQPAGAQALLAAQGGGLEPALLYARALYQAGQREAAETRFEWCIDHSTT